MSILNIAEFSLPTVLERIVSIATFPPNQSPSTKSFIMSIDNKQLRMDSRQRRSKLSCRSKRRMLLERLEDRHLLAALSDTPSDWMAGLSDHMELSEITIPGTHDTMSIADNITHARLADSVLDMIGFRELRAEVEGIDNTFLSAAYDQLVRLVRSPLLYTVIGGTLLEAARDLTVTQSLHLDEQLDSGIRYLDIRTQQVGQQGKGLDIYHGPFYLGSSFDDVLSGATEFLSTHPSETIVMRVGSNECTSFHDTLCSLPSGALDFDSVVQAHLAPYESYVWRQGSVEGTPTLGEVRGKIVFLRNNWEPIDVGYAWHDGTFLDKQDNDKATDPATKWVDAGTASVQGFLEKTDSGTSDKLYLNHLTANDPAFGVQLDGTGFFAAITGIQLPDLDSFVGIDFTPDTGSFWGNVGSVVTDAFNSVTGIVNVFDDFVDEVIDTLYEAIGSLVSVDGGPRAVASAINPIANEYFGQNTPNRTGGIVIMDFVGDKLRWLDGLEKDTDELVGKIIDQNRERIIVTTEMDTVNANDGKTSLREAIAEANLDTRKDVIEFSTAELAGKTITLNSPLPPITGNLTIAGLGADQLSISGASQHQIFSISATDQRIANTITANAINGDTPFTSPTLDFSTVSQATTIVDVEIFGLTIRDGSAPDGGAIINHGRLSVVDSMLSNNTATNRGGGIFNDGGSVKVTNSTHAGNAATDGGGIFNSGGSLIVTNSTHSGNSATSGGAVYNDFGTTAIVSSTLSGNEGIGGGIFNANSGSVALLNSIIAGNTTLPNTPSDMEGADVDVTLSKNNLIGDTTTSGGLSQGTNGNIVGVADISTVLDTNLDNNGGTTQTLDLVSSSPAINAGAGNAGPKDLQTLELTDVEAYYQFAEDTGNTEAVDASAHQRDATYAGGAAPGAQGHSAFDPLAASFDGVNDYVDAPDGFADFTNGISVAAWVYPTQVKNWARIIDFGNGQGDQGGDNILLTRVGTTNNLAWHVWKNGVQQQVVATNAIELNKWQHFAITQDAAGNAKLYKNGKEIASGIVHAPSNVPRTNNYIGRSNWPDEYFKGRMGEVAIFNRSLLPFELNTFLSVGIPGKASNLNGNDQRGAGFPRQINTIDIGAIESQSTLRVDSTSDIDDGDYSDGQFSLREAITLANTIPGTNEIIIDVPGNSIHLDAPLPAISPEFSQAQPILALAITGPGADSISINGEQHRVFEILADAVVEITGLTIENGRGASPGGGAALNKGTLTVSQSVLSNNATSAGGGGIANHLDGAALTIVDSTLSGNSASIGGAIVNFLGTVTIVNSTIANNESRNNGGAVINGNGAVTIRNSTVSGNTADNSGGGVDNQGTLYLYNTIVAGNLRGEEWLQPFQNVIAVHDDCLAGVPARRYLRGDRSTNLGRVTRGDGRGRMVHPRSVGLWPWA